MCLIAVLFCNDAQAVVTLAGTRLVFDGQYHEATIDVSNPDRVPVLIQAWVEEPGAGRVDLPFVLTPALVQIPPQGRQVLRLLYQGLGMPTDRESLLHLYVLEVPRRSEAPQQLNIAVRQRINVFYRPSGLDGYHADAPQRLLWQRDIQQHGAFTVRNPTPFHASLLKIRFNGIEISEDLMLEPFSGHSLRWPAPPAQTPAQGALTFTALTDYGGQREFCAPVLDAKPSTARVYTGGDHGLLAHSLIGKCPP